MKKYSGFLKIFLLILVLCTGLSACGGEKEAETAVPLPKETAETVQWPEISPQKLQNDALTGDWYHSIQNSGFYFDGVGRFWYTDLDDAAQTAEGRYQYDGRTLYLKTKDGRVCTGSIDKAGNLSIDRMDGYFFFVFPEAQLDLSLVGTWTYIYSDLQLTFDDQGQFHVDSPKETFDGTYFFDGASLDLYDGDNMLETGSLTEDGRLTLDSLNGWFYTDGGITYEARSKQDALSLEPNSDPLHQRLSLPGSVAYHTPDGSSYTTGEGQWTVVQNESVDVGDGDKEVSFVISCFIPISAVPSIDGSASYSIGYYLYDRYTGLPLKASPYFEDEHENYCFEFDSRDGRVDLCFDLDQEYTGPYGDCIDIMSSIYTVRMPAWYDGLMIAPMPQPDTYDEFVKERETNWRSIGADIIEDSDGQIQSTLRYSVS